MKIDQCVKSGTDEIMHKTGEKYSLRQRQKRTSSRKENNAKVSEIISTEIDLIGSSVSTPNASKSSNSKKGKEKSKSKQKAAPLSKYRRKTANARERTRMREINSAFENLRKCVPLSISDGTPTSSNEKLTKITTLRLAMKYISTLNDVLNSTYDRDTSFLLNSIINKDIDMNEISDNNYNNNNNNNDSNTVNNNNISNLDKLSTSHSTAKSKNKSRKSASVASKGVSKRSTKVKTPKSNRSRSTKKTETYLAQEIINNVCLTPPTSIDSPIDLGLMLESDGESLHLSEPCLSPLSSQPIKPFACSLAATNNNLDIGLFLESDTDSLQFSEPCLSPLGGFDALSPFGDLLHSNFTEHSSLDIYLT